MKFIYQLSNNLFVDHKQRHFQLGNKIFQSKYLKHELLNN